MYAETKLTINGKELLVFHVFPPVPVRHWDYMAIYAEDVCEECHPYGEGASIEDAVQNLFNNVEI